MGMLNENHEDTPSGDDTERESIGPDGADDGLSLDQLSEAYAQLIDGGIDPYRRPTPPPESSSLAIRRPVSSRKNRYGSNTMLVRSMT